MRVGPHRLPAFLGVGLVAAFLAVPASAESIRLKSGKDLDVQSVRVLDGRLNVTVRSDGESSRVELRFDQVEPRALLKLLDRYADPKDPAVQVRNARLALDYGLREEAAVRFHAAARIDPAFVKDRDAGIAAIRAREAEEGLADLEARVRDGRDPRGAVMLAAAILDSAYTEALTAKQRRRVDALGAFARRLVARAVAREARAESEALATQKASPKAGFPKKGAASGGNAIGDAGGSPLQPAHDPIESVLALLTKALHARERAADPALSSERAIRFLEIAAKALLDGRRLVRQVPTPGMPLAVAQDVQALALDLRAWLVATYLDLADLYRQEGWFDEARARVRAVLILDPGNEDAWKLRRLIEDDLREAYTPVRDPYRYTIRSPVFFGFYGASPFYGHSWGYSHAVPYHGYGGTNFSHSGYRGGSVRHATRGHAGHGH